MAAVILYSPRRLNPTAVDDRDMYVDRVNGDVCIWTYVRRDDGEFEKLDLVRMSVDEALDLAFSLGEKANNAA